MSDFSPLAEPEFVDVDEFRRDVSRPGELFGHECDRVYLMGGEPLLHPNIIEIINIVRENLTKGDIYVFSNGILLPKMPNDFWRACRDNNIKVRVSAYPIKIDTDTIRAKADKFGVNFAWAWDASKHTHDMFSIVPINLGGDSDINLQFGMCNRKNNCIVLSHGRLFTCSFATHVHHFNKYFGQNVIITEDDYIDIYQDLIADEICQKLNEPIPACRYCKKVEPVKTIVWEPSKRKWL